MPIKTYKIEATLGRDGRFIRLHGLSAGLESFKHSLYAKGIPEGLTGEGDQFGITFPTVGGLSIVNLTLDETKDSIAHCTAWTLFGTDVMNQDGAGKASLDEKTGMLESLHLTANSFARMNMPVMVSYSLKLRK